jgi:hypothetical protein
VDVVDVGRVVVDVVVDAVDVGVVEVDVDGWRCCCRGCGR